MNKGNKKLNLSTFLDTYKVMDSQVAFTLDANFTYPLSSFTKEVYSHLGIFIINDVSYSNVIASANNIYFFNDLTESEYMIIFDPIIDIKRKGSGFTVFYYPDHIINVVLKDYNVKEIESV